MSIVLLAGGLGTRLQEETTSRPKPMVEIGGRPILWHIMKHYAHHGHDDFHIACGYMGDFIKGYFLDQYNLSGDLSIDFSRNVVSRQESDAESWRVNLVDTGINTQTGGRLLRLKPRLESGTFLLTYGDGVSDVDISALLDFHRSHGRLATVTAVRPPARFGGLIMTGDFVDHFTEKPVSGEGWINGGFLVFEPGIFDYLSSDLDSLEADALERVAADGQLAAYRHHGFWQCMDTLRDKQYLQRLWEDGSAPWRTWDRDEKETRLRIRPQVAKAA
ncbi:glucose-1-phosphate cytidylyltransferase [Neorhodopirellula pilleata]|uniref:Glucose-1-phosphate cytidylyltransferase n=1 Tax=Neorhodopirellula pilleata TaxID=2714738 RepID=A0A5C6A6U6_9BACT|nr:glucose-1-phosphate cytidylyltransferase [Neorhodopirellula pilleata]TWT95614.1 Glucose-1-phosphate cytidylyltransferase [Neorhodopirellula pilleata]